MGKATSCPLQNVLRDIFHHPDISFKMKYRRYSCPWQVYLFGFKIYRERALMSGDWSASKGCVHAYLWSATALVHMRENCNIREGGDFMLGIRSAPVGTRDRSHLIEELFKWTLFENWLLPTLSNQRGKKKDLPSLFPTFWRYSIFFITYTFLISICMVKKADLFILLPKDLRCFFFLQPKANRYLTLVQKNQDL